MGIAPRMARASAPPEVAADFSADVVVGLSQPGQKELPSKYLYDELGSALFDAICLLPEYGLSRAGMRLLQLYSQEIVSLLPTPVMVAELGSGSGQKTRLLLEALSRRQRVNYYPIDISGSALSRCEQEIGQIDRVSIVGFERAYLDGLQEVAARRRDGEQILVLFLGSTIGNFDRPAGEQFLRGVRGILRENDALLLATDLEKPIAKLLLAYDDPTGVTAAFNMNLLGRINRDLGADFDLKQFRHVARYDESERRVEMHLLSKVWQ
ncbi:MAG: L-histidine N(alpha)-methyltransferase, partial [Candidatus Acidiferrales bacterium]